jgi:hypothetical protein
VPWVKLSDDWYDDPDLIEAGPAAMLLWPLLISWCARNLTDGRIPEGQVRRLVDWHTLGVDPEQAIAPLVDTGRLQSVAGGYLVTNYLQYQPSRERVLADRDAAKDRAAKSRKRAANVREPCGDAAPPPVPVPDVSPPRVSSPVPETEPPDPVENPAGKNAVVPESVWETYANRKRAQATGITNESAWRSKVIRNAKKDHGHRAAELWDIYDITPGQLADVLLNGGTSPTLGLLRRRGAA